MRARISWMTNNDDPILEFLHERNLALPPRVIEHNLSTREGINIPYSTINHRLKLLLDAGFVEKEYEQGGFYSITDLGRRYLAGELTEEEREQLQDEHQT